MDLETWLHFLHISAAVVWVGGGLMLVVIGLRARSNGDLARIGDFADSLAYVGLRLFMPAVIVLLVTGVWMVFLDGGDFGQLWVLLALGAFVLAFVVGAGYLSRVVIGLERTASQADATLAAVSDGLQRWIVGYLVVLGVLVFAMWDMVFKPGL